MEVFIPLLAIVLTFSVGFFAIWTEHRRKLTKLRIDAAAQQGGEHSRRHANEVRALEDRVRVLERIVTDRGFDVATQIEMLRDQRRAEGQLAQRESA